MGIKMNQNSYDILKENSLTGYPTEKTIKKEKIDHSLYMEKLKNLYSILLYQKLEHEDTTENLIHKIEQYLMIKENNQELKSGANKWMK